MISALPWLFLTGFVVLVFVVALRVYLAPDAGVLTRLQSERHSLYEVARSELEAARSQPGVAAERSRQLELVREQQARIPDKFAGEFIANTADEGQHDPRPLYVTLLSKPQKLLALSDIDLVKWVLSDPVTFDRARTLESFAGAFRLQSVFTTKDTELHPDLKSYFTRHTNGLSVEELEAMSAILQQHADRMIQAFVDEGDVAFIPKVEGMVLEAYAESFFGMEHFADAEECAVLIKKVWQAKSLRNNVLPRRWDPLLRARERKLQRRLFEIIDNAQATADAAGSPASAEMAEVYRRNGYEPGNLLNALIPLYEAIARGVVYALIELANNPTVQNDLRREFADNVDDELQYLRSTKTLLHRVWQETLRLRPPTPNQTRRVTVRDHALFPLDSKVVVVWSLFHQDKSVWGDDANEFVPDRWLDATAEQARNYNPFGSGAQRCVAMNYASFGGRVLLKRLVESTLIEHPAPVHDAVLGTDRGYSRGPDPDTSILSFAIQLQDDPGPVHAL